MDLRQLEVFAGVYELRSFSRAASALRLTQSTVSEHVRLLEEELGTRVFDRLSRETVPTRAGELLYGYARRMLLLRTEARRIRVFPDIGVSLMRRRPAPARLTAHAPTHPGAALT